MSILFLLINFHQYSTSVNANRVLIRFSGGGASSFPCSETHGGSAPFSDIETKSMSEYIKSINKKFFAYISFHSFSQLLMFPYGYTSDHLENYDELVSNPKNEIIKWPIFFFWNATISRKIYSSR